MILIISCLHTLHAFSSLKSSCFMHLDTTLIHWAYLLIFLFAQYLCRSIEVFLTWPSLPLNRSSSSCMLFMCESCFAFFFSSLYVHSILFSCFSGRSMFPCSPYSFYASFLFVSSHVFFVFLCPLTIMSKMGRNLSFECYSLGGVTDLGGELHVRGRRNFLM